MAIADFPTSLQPIIQQNMLQREFKDALVSKLGYRDIAERTQIPVRIGQTLTLTRAGLKGPVTTPANPANNTNIDNGMTSSTWSVEQYTIGINQYNDTIDLNIVTEKVGLASQAIQNAKVNAIQAKQTLDQLAQAALFQTYCGGNTIVRVTLSAASTTVSVDNVLGFMAAPVDGVMQPVSSTNPISVTIGSDVYTCIGATMDSSNNSALISPGGGSLYYGWSGVLTLSTAVTVADGTLGNQVVMGNAPTVLRPSAVQTWYGLTSANVLTLSTLLQARSILKNNNVPTFPGGYYRVLLNSTSMTQLFSDQQFEWMFRGEYKSSEMQSGQIVRLLGMEFMENTESFAQANGSVNIQRPIMVGAGALIEGDFAGMAAEFRGAGDTEGEVHEVDGIVQVIRAPLDRLKQIIAQSWYSIVGFAVPTDITATKQIIPTSNGSYWKRGVLIEHGS